MEIRVIKVTPKFFGDGTQELLKEGNLDMEIYPITGDIVFIDDVKYKVLQRDICMRNTEPWIRYFVKQLN